MSIFARKSPALDDLERQSVAPEHARLSLEGLGLSYTSDEIRPLPGSMASGGYLERQSVATVHIDEREYLIDAYGNIRPIPGEHPVKNLPVPEKSPVAVAPDSPDDQYRALAAKLGIRSTALLAAELECLLASEMIPVYDYQKVAQYLENECRKASLSQPRTPWTTTLMWCWKPVREQDRLENKSYAPISSNLYQQALRLPVLLTMERIAEKLPEAKFFVSEIEAVLDPFLAVTVEGAGKLYVIERWDEPGFRS